MSKHPLGGRTDVSEDSDVHSERVLDAARRSACGNGFSVTESAERARPWIRRLFQDRRRIFRPDQGQNTRLVGAPTREKSRTCTRRRVLAAARGSARGNVFSVTESAERARSWIKRLFEYPMTPECVSDA